MSDPVSADAMRRTLTEGAAALGVDLDDGQVARLLAYLDAVLDWNTKVNLTAVREPVEAVLRHLVDSLSLVPAWRTLAGDAPPRRVLDLGTGGGFPGAPLAVSWPDARVLQIDGTLKKVKIVNDCLNRAGIANASAFQCRGDQLPAVKPDARHGFDLCVARAVGPAPALLDELWRLTASGGLILLMKGPEPPEDELAAARETAARRHLEVLEPQPTGLPGGQRGLALAYRSLHRPSERPTPPSDPRRGRRAGASGRRGRGSGGSSRAR